MKLTPNFYLDEFVHDGDKPPTGAIVVNIRQLAQRLQVIRDITGKRIRINSGYRSLEHNAEVGGKPDSYHLRGMAADIVIVGMTPREVQELLKNWSGGLGSYETFTHVDIRDYRARWEG